MCAKCKLWCVEDVLTDTYLRVHKHRKRLKYIDLKKKIFLPVIDAAQILIYLVYI